jgi:hypothetical protein
MTANDRYTDTRDHPERTLVLNVDLSRGLVAALLVLAVVVVAALLVRGPHPLLESRYRLPPTGCGASTWHRRY